ncbi:lamin tail domain-containing protein [Candidatus Parabeggiatoa sp. HSG14]|uniref:Calx-beta domain-containing protein n=1 Tax=Candidatus Parabeggiatoa sp. HSG14 TaxID=3055593 RepID=UPI0025A8DE34|nr:lamin tail domain-containing protein [Thiotrichales bacterium HSG14]
MLSKYFKSLIGNASQHQLQLTLFFRESCCIMRSLFLAILLLILNTQFAYAELSVSITDSPDPVQLPLPATLDYEVVISNNGLTATDVNLVITLPNSVELQSVNSDNGMCDVSSFPTISCMLADITASSNASVQVGVNVVTESFPVTFETKVTSNEYADFEDIEFTNYLLVINEIDYEQPSTDIAEFIELKNVSGATINLDPYTVELYNNATATVYKTIDLPNVDLTAGDYYVICGNNATVANCDLDHTTDTDLIQNGPQDAIALKLGTFTVDAVSYNGTATNISFTEGTGASADSSSEAFVGLSRYTDGKDTNNNSADFQLKCITPGTANNMTDGDDCYRLYLSEASVTEGNSGTKTLDVAVNLTQPSTSDITVEYRTEDTSGAVAGDDYVAIGLTQLTFPAGDNTPQTISVTINGDEIDEGVNEDFKVRLYDPSNNAQITTVAHEIYAIITDDDNAGFTVNPTSLSISEPNTLKTFGIKLNSKPTDNVIVNLPDSLALLECSLDKTALTFTPSDWNIEQTVTVTAQDDALQDGTQNCDVMFDSSQIITGDTNYQNQVPSNIIVQVEDDESPGGSITENGGSTQVSEDGLTTNTYDFVLRQPPTDNVTVDLSIDLSTQFQCEIIDPLPAQLVFTSGDWDIAQTVTVQGIPDETAETAIHDCIIVHDFSNISDTDYSSLPNKNLTVGVVDDDKAEIIIEAMEPFMISEPDSTMDFTIKLTSQPINGEDVTVGLSTSNSQCSVPSSVTINNSDWFFGQSVTVTATDDSITDGEKTCIVQTANSTSADPNYVGINPDDVTVKVQDDDISDVIVNGTPTIVEGGATGTYTLALNTTPTGNVTIGITPDAQCEVSLDGTTFGATQNLTRNDKTSQTVTVRAINDLTLEGNHTCTITHQINGTINDSNYPTSMSILDATANITDDDPGVIITQNSGSIAVTEGGATDSYTVKLNTAPTNDVNITVTPNAQTDVGNGAGIAKTLTAFNNSNWNSTQTVTVTAADDNTYEGNHSSTISHTSIATNQSTDSDYDSGSVIFLVDGTETANVIVNITDNDSPPSPPPASTPPSSTPSVSTPIYNNQPSFNILNVGINGNGDGVILSEPSGIDCTRSDNAICQNEFSTGTTITLTATPIEGSEFIGWSNNTCSDEEFTITSDMECIATFKSLPKTLTVTINGNGSIKSVPLALNCDETTEKCSHTFSSSRIKLIATPDSVTWEGDCDENGFVVLTTDKECKANFVQDSVETPPPVITPIPEETPVTPEDSTPVVTLPEETQVVTQLPDTLTVGTPEDWIPAQNQVTLTVTKVGSGTIINSRQDFFCHNDAKQCNHMVDSGETITLTATPNNDWQFDSWVGDCDKTGKITLSANQACEAIFTPIAVPSPVQPVVEPAPPVSPTPVVETPVIEVEETPRTTTEPPKIVVPITTGVEEIPIRTTTEPPQIVVPITTGDGTTKMVTKPITPPSDGKLLCPTTGIVNWVCDAKWQELTQMIIETQGNVANGIVIDTLINRGRFGNIQIHEGAVVQCEGENSTVSGYIENRGTLIDCNFKGREIKGGTLSGTITNTSDIDGYFQDVHFAPETHISGGELRGHITTDPDNPAVISNVTIAAGSMIEGVIVGDKVVVKPPKGKGKPTIFKDILLAPNAHLTGGQLEGFVMGDSDAPAKLENVTIYSDSHIDNVSLGENITFLSENVTLGEWVQVITPPTVILSDEQEACINGNGIDIEGNAIEQACFVSGIETEAGVQANGVKLASIQAKIIQLSVTIRVLPKHRYQAAKMLIVAEHQLSGNTDYYMRDGETWTPWDVNIDSLKPANSHKRLPFKLKVAIFKGDLSGLSGEFKVFVGYQLADGTLIFNGKKPLHFFVAGY